MNTITINFIECTPAPASGYNLKWRVAGSGDPYTDEGNFTSTPIQFVDNVNPEGTCYEGTLQSDCSESGESGTLLGEAIPWTTPCPESGSLYEITLSGSCLPGNPFSNFVISGGSPGDTLVVRATFTGLLQKTSALFTRADLGISSPSGTSAIQASTCYSDSAPHGFSITADTNITMTSSTAIVNTTAVIHNGSESPTNLIVSIISINGSPYSEIFATGCKGNSGTGGTC